MTPDPADSKAILLVDDNDLVRTSLKHALQAKNFKVVEARDGAEGLRSFGESQFDLVITDLDMPGMSGEVLAAKIKQNAPAPPVILITGCPDLLVGPMRSVDEILIKPFGMKLLQEAIARLLPAN